MFTDKTLLALLTGAALLTAACADSKAPPTRAGDIRPAPEFTVRAADGQTLTLDSFKNKILLVNFWAVWSPPCAREIPELMHIRQSFGADADRIAILGICLESQNLSDVEQVAAQFGINYPIVIAANNDLVALFGGIDAIPTTFVIDPAGNIVNRYTGKILPNELKHELAYMIDQIKTGEKDEADAAKFGISGR